MVNSVVDRSEDETVSETELMLHRGHPRGGKPKENLAECRFETPLGMMVAVACSRGLLLLGFHDQRRLSRQINRVCRETQGAVVAGKSVILDQIQHEMREYFAGGLKEFKTPLVVHGSTFQRRVWEQLGLIPHGETRSYAQIAARIGSPNAVRAVGGANGANPLCIVIPCHRVIRADGDLCGWGGGAARKRALLKLEGG